MPIRKAESLSEKDKFERDKLIELLQREEQTNWSSLAGNKKYLKEISDFKKANGFSSVYEAIQNDWVNITRYGSGKWINYLLMAKHDTLVLRVSKDYSMIGKPDTLVDLVIPNDFEEESRRF